jgi:drug/metabolite transporter (DMT)-like permease
MPTGSLSSVLAALAGSACFGVAAVLQAMGARRADWSGPGLDPRLLWRLLRSAPYLAGLALDGVGFLLALVAMRRLPVFVVEAIFASYVAVVAVLASWLLGAVLRPREWWALTAVVVGVAMLGSSASAQPAPSVAAAVKWTLLGIVALLGASAVLIAPRRSAGRASAVALLGGLLWGLSPIAIRSVRAGALTELVTDPAAYVVPAAGGLGLLLYTIALQRTSVTAATAMAIVGETFVPAIVGVLLLGDRPRPAAGALAVTGFLLTVGGGLVLARYGEIDDTVPAGKIDEIGATDEINDTATAGEHGDGRE